MDNVTIRPLVPKDGDAIARLWEELVAYHRRLDTDLPRAAMDGGQIYVERMINRFDDPESRVYVAEYEGRVIGYVLGAVVDLVPDMFVQETSGFLADIYVAEAFRGQGIGRRLVNALAGWFKAQGVHYFEWYVASRNADGIEFWRSIGGRDMMVRMRVEIQEDDV